jgi:probable HAF family extracellular repeat protein
VRKPLGIAVRASVAVLVALAVSSASSSVARSTARPLPTYTFIDLGSLPGDEESAAEAVNAAGSAVGWSQGDNSGEISHPVIWRKGDISLLPGGDVGRGSNGATGINAADDIVGSLNSPSSHGVIWRGGGDAPETLSGGFNVNPSGVNDNVEVAGTAPVSGSAHAIVIGHDGAAADLGPGAATAINSLGDVAGDVFTSAGDRGAIWSHADRSLTLLPPLPGANRSSDVDAVNDAMDAVGYTSFPQSGLTLARATLWPNGSPSPTDLGTLSDGSSKAYGVNNDGDIVGWSTNAAGGHRAVLWRNGQLIELAPQVAGAAGWDLYEANAINDSGVIVGDGSPDGGQHERAFMLCPTGLVAAGGRGCGAKPQLVGLEVNQSVQNWHDSVPLTEGKATFVRAFVRWPLDGTKTVRLELAGSSNGADLPGSPLLPLNGAFEAKKTIDRSVFSESVNFRLPVAWTRGSVTLTVQPVEPTDGSPTPLLGCQEPAGKDCSVAATFNPVGALRVRFVAIPWTDSTTGQSYPAPSLAVAGAQGARLQSILPSARVLWDYVPGETVSAPLTDPADPAKVRPFTLWNPIVAKLLQMREADGCLASCNTLYLGLVTNPAAWLLGGMAAAIPANVAVAAPTSIPQKYEVVAHEVGHDLGENHTVSSTLGLTADGSKQGWCGEVADPAEPDWKDVFAFGSATYPAIGPMTKGDGLLDYGLETQTASGNPIVIDPHLHADFMSYCDNNALNQTTWISSRRYLHLIAALDSRFDAPTVRALARLRTTTPSLLVRGEIDGPTGTVTFLPFDTDASGAGAASPPSGPFTLEARDSSGAVVASVPFGVGAAHADGPSGQIPADKGNFLISIPDTSDIARVDVMEGATELVSRSASAHAPTVHVLSPNGGETPSGMTTIRWSASDADLDPLTFTVQASPDGGATWRTLADGLAGSSLSVDAADLPGSTQSIVRVRVSDGFHSAEDVSDAPFTVSNHAPLVGDVSPSDGAQYDPGQSIVLSAAGFDFEDGSLADGAVTWSIDGAPAGHGTVVLNASTLTLGRHVATVRVVDSAGAATVATAGFSVGMSGSSSGGSSPSSTNQPAPGSTPAVTPSPSQSPPSAPARTLPTLGGASARPERAVVRGRVAVLTSAFTLDRPATLLVRISGGRPILAGSVLDGIRSGRNHVEFVHVAYAGLVRFSLRIWAANLPRTTSVVVTATDANGSAALRIPFRH